MLAKETKVYRDTLLFVDELMRITINFKREYRRTLAERLENKSIELIDYIVLANSSMEHRLYYLQQFTVCFEQVNALLDLAVRRSIQHYSKGIKFTGSVVKFGRVYPAKRTVGNFMTAIYKLNKAKDVEEIRDCIQSVNSYLGILRHTDSYAIRRRVLGMIDERLWQYVYIKGHFEILCLKEKHKKVEIPWRDKGLKVYYMKDPINWKLLEEDDPVI